MNATRALYVAIEIMELLSQVKAKPRVDLDAGWRHGSEPVGRPANPFWVYLGALLFRLQRSLIFDRITTCRRVDVHPAHKADFDLTR